MHNIFLEYLLENEPEKVMSKKRLIIRKILSPIIRNYVAPFSSNKYHINKNTNLPKGRPLIFAATHEIKDNILMSPEEILNKTENHLETESFGELLRQLIVGQDITCEIVS